MYETDTLLDNRYLLLTCIGRRNYIEFWLAADTADNDHQVAVKIYCDRQGNPSRDATAFDKARQSMSNVSHPGLLIPLHFGIDRGSVPYLVYNMMPNGSINSLFGRATDSEVTHFIHDMASVLAYLHGINEVHGELRPDSVAIDNDGNFRLGGYGMGHVGSTRKEAQVDPDDAPYMAPEVYENDASDTASDIWSVGAMAYQMITGEPPYGDYGGYMLDKNDTLPPIERRIDPKLRSLINRMLARDPAQRPSAMSIEHETESMLSGQPLSLLRKRRAVKLTLLLLLAVASVSALVAYDRGRLKSYYYTDYINRYGVPEGIDILNGSQVRRMQFCYRIDRRGGRVERLTVVNSDGRPIPNPVTSNNKERFDMLTYTYHPDGHVDYKTVHNYEGRPLFAIDYNEDFTMAIIRTPGKNGEETIISATDNVHHHNYELGMPAKNQTSRYRLRLNDRGMLVERQYLGRDGVPLARNGNVYGHSWVYDDNDRIIEEHCLGYDRQLIEDRYGVAVTKYEYDSHGRLESMTFFDSDMHPAFNSTGCSEVNYEYDRNGNMVLETYYTDNGQTAQRTDRNVAGYVYTYDDKGRMVRRSSFDIEGKNTFSLRGYVAQLNDYDENGFLLRTQFVDDKDKPILAQLPEGNAAAIVYRRDSKGRPTMVTTLDESGHPLENNDGIATTKSDYNARGQVIRETYFSKDGLPTYYRGLYHSRNYTYDKLGRLVGIKLGNIDGSPATNSNRVHEFMADYNERGVVTRINLFDVDGKLINVPAGYAAIEYDYNGAGNVTKIVFLNNLFEESNITGGYSRVLMDYAKGANVVTRNQKVRADGSTLSTEVNEYDSLWRMKRHYILDGDTRKLMPGTSVSHIKYNSANRPCERRYTDLQGNPVDSSGTCYSIVRMGYDRQGNRNRVSLFGRDGKPVAIDGLVHERRYVYDSRNRVTEITQIGVDGKPLSDPDRPAVTRYKYNKWNNCCETAYFNAQGKPVEGPEGFHRTVKSYNARGVLLSAASYDRNNRPAIGLENGYARVEYRYNPHGDTVARIYYDTASMVRRDSLTYNSNNRQTGLRIENAAGELDDSFAGYSQVRLFYDENGTTPERCEFFDSNSKLLSNRVWVRRLGSWSRAIPSTNIRFMRDPGHDWYNELLNYASSCPMRINSIVEVTSISVTSSGATLFLRVSNFTGHDAQGRGDMSAMRDYCTSILAEISHDIDLPANVKLSANVVDNHNNTLFRI